MSNTFENPELKILLKTLSSKSGNDYFEILVLELWKIIKTQYIFIGELSPDSSSIQTIALCKEGELKSNFNYKLKDTPCKNVIDDAICFYKENVQKLFPKDLLLIEMKIESYFGLPLHDLHGYPNAILVLLDEKPNREEFPKENSFLEILAILVGTELSKVKMENQLREREEKYRVTLDSIVDAVIVTDEKGNINRMNSVAENLTAWKIGEDLDFHLIEVLELYDSSTNERIEVPLEKLLLDQEPINQTKNTYLINKNGETKQISYSGAPIHNDKGVHLGSIFILHDITKIYELETQLHHSQKMESIGKLAGGIAHDFNNIIGGILGCAEIIKRKAPPSEIVDTYINHIINASERSNGLTRQLLDFSRQGKVYTTSIKIHDIIRETVTLLESTLDKRINISLTLMANDDHIQGDAGQLQNSILNLCINSSDAINDKGTIEITTENIELSKEKAFKYDLSLPGKYLKVSIIDNGVGMEQQTLPHIFEPFYTTKNIGKGTGLGLSAVYGAVKDHLGSIQVSSKKGEGSNFSIYLPATQTENQNKNESKKISNSFKSKTNTILVVDDEELIRESAKDILEDSGFNVLIAENGNQALEIFEENHNTINLVILDLVMPILEGADVYKKIRATCTDLPVILSSGYSKDAAVSSMLDISTNFLQKPYSSKELIKAVKKLSEA